MHIYLAGPLFTHAERAFMELLRDRMRQVPGIEVTWPGDLFDDAHLASLGVQAKAHIFQGCMSTLDASTHVVAVLDGPQVDDGTAWEVGYAFAKGKPIWGLRTDFRNGGDTGHSMVNCMIECACGRMFRTSDDVLAALAVSVSDLIE